MKITMISPEYPPMQGGVGDYTSLLAAALTDQGIEVAVITSDRARYDAPERAGVSYVPNWGPASWTTILNHVRIHRPDVLHVQYQTAGYGMRLAINLLPARLRTSRLRPALVTTFHDLKVPYMFPKAGRLREVPAALLAGLSDAVIYTNHEDVWRAAKASQDGAGLRTRFQSRPLYAIPIGSNILATPPADYERGEWRHRLGVAPDETLLCYFGFLNRTKGIETLLAAFERLLARGNRMKLLMAGAPFGDSDPTNVAYGRNILESIERSTYRHLVIRTGFADSSTISAAMLASDIGVLPFEEGVSLRHGTLMALIAHGLPIVTTISGQPRDGRAEALIAHCSLPSLVGRASLVPPRQPEALANEIERLARSEEERNLLRSKALELATAFSWQTIARETMQVYASLRKTHNEVGMRR